MELIVDAIIFQAPGPSGSVRLYSEILKRACTLESELHVAMLTTGACRHPLPDHPRIRHIPLLPVNQILRPQHLWGSAVPWSRAWLQNIALRHRKHGIWHSTYYTSPRSWEGPIVTLILDMIYELFPAMFTAAYDDRVRMYKRRNILSADRVLCISETSRKDACQIYGLDERKTVVVHLAHSPEFHPMNTGSERAGSLEKPFLLYVGRRGLYKNFDSLAAAYSRWKRASEADIIAVGPPWSPQEKQRLSDLGIEHRVNLRAAVSDEELCRLYNRAAAFIYPSLYEGFGIPLLEAMACGCPIVASRIPSTVEVAAEHPIYFDPADEDGLLSALDAAISEGRGSARTRRGLEHVKQFSWDTTASRVLDVYRSIT